MKDTSAAPEIGIDDVLKLDVRVGVVREAYPVEESEKLVRLMLDLGEGRNRQVFAGIRSAYPEPETLLGRKVLVVANLKPRKMKFGLSEGMILAAGDDETLSICTVDDGPGPGDKVS
ncbi:MAG: methionine--tRNA ligase subunit beta [Desulfomonilia bacterium]